MSEPKKLIEVAMPIKEISAASVHDKYIHHGHISTLHIWWARRPLPVSRAVVFASLIPDPLDINCPNQVKDAIEKLLGSKNNPLFENGIVNDNYKPYSDIPFTSNIDEMEDNLRNRLMMFIGKFSEEFLINEKAGKQTSVGKQINNSSLIKWENKSNDKIINIARKLIWVSHNSTGKCQKTAGELLEEFDEYYAKIINAENKLYSIIDRHLPNFETDELEVLLQEAIDSFQNKMPKVFDPFAGGGAIPLEAARLGCKSYGNDINPVAHVIQKGSVEYPQKFGKRILFSKYEFIKKYNIETFNTISNKNKIFEDGNVVGIQIDNILSFDVEYYAKLILNECRNEIGHIYPDNKQGNKPLVYYWARIGTCSNPTCSAEVPLLRGFNLTNKGDDSIYLKPIISESTIDFEITKGLCSEEGWIQRANLKCPCCGSITDVKNLKKQFFDGKTTERLLAVIEEGKNGKTYRAPNKDELEVDIPDTYQKPIEKLPTNDSQNLKITFWGFPTFGDMFSKRQLFAIQTLCSKLNLLEQKLDATNSEYNKAIVTFLAIWIDRIASYMTSFGRWIPQNEQLTSVFGKQAIPMVFDFPEVSLFSPTTSGALNQLEWILMYLDSENKYPFTTTCINATSGDKTQFENKYLTAVITDPPYYDAIAYADLSDFFYVWLKRTVSNLYPLNFATPQTPKTEECTALKHNHKGNKLSAKLHFENKLLQIFDAIEHQTSDIISIMFAHQSTEAWTTLCNSILGARMNITGSWAIDSERDTRMIANAGAALQSSVTVACKPIERSGIGSYKEIKDAIEKRVEKEVEILYSLGFRGADLLTACFGQAVSEFGKYSNVEKADGSEVLVSELLEIARESAFNALLKGFTGDDYTKFYIGWLQLNGFVEGDNDDAAKFTKVGLSIDVQDLYREHILLKIGNKQHLANLKERVSLNNKLGEQKNCSLIDLGHKMMHLYSSPNRNNLLKFIEQNAAEPESPLWRVLTSLVELLPKDMEDHKLAVGLLTNKDQLIREAKSSNTPKPEQSQLTFE